MTKETKAQMEERLREEKVELLSTQLSAKLSRKDFREANQALGIDKNDESDEYGTLIILAKKKKPSLTYEELDQMGMGELYEVVFGKDLLPKELRTE